ncbi:toll/interleukin-1 receptor domain-containing protein [Neisseria sp.]|uniref:toll/interleukin-1 receptor domain-containing protein n=1 Tax=Neisseria sp. TaxID=192066 RepID=UPI002896CC25|nr:toll/interleukin-1 receptor domain-containing protein [Neisseria sp.]
MDFASIAHHAFEIAPQNPDGKKDLKDIAFEAYKIYIKSQFPDMLSYWPVVAGTHYKLGSYGNFDIVILIDQGPTSFIQTMSIGSLNLSIPEKEKNNPELIKREISRLMNLNKRDAIFLFNVNNNYESWSADLERDLKVNFLQHKLVMNMQPMKIFLSHKSINKDKVRDFKKTLELLGFLPWLDEEAMSAGANLERALQQGMSDSCAAIFFITPDYKDEKYLASEIDYAIARKREEENFSIITLVFSNENGEKGIVPTMLKPYVWKEPANDLIALNEILKSLPLEVGDIRFK